MRKMEKMDASAKEVRFAFYLCWHRFAVIALAIHLNTIKRSPQMVFRQLPDLDCT